jgi:exosortase
VKRSTKRGKHRGSISAESRAPSSLRWKASFARLISAAGGWARRLDRIEFGSAAARALTGSQQTWIAALLAAAFCWSYWPVLQQLWNTWGREADYSHGYLVLPVALGMLWLRRASRPDASVGFSLWGLGLLGLSFLVRSAGAIWYIDAFEGWSIPLWAGGVIWLMGGAALFRWSLPALLFLGFMIPLPYRADAFLSLPLQRVAANLSCWLLQCLGEPAITEGNVVLIDNVQLLVAEACSGLRIFMSVLALAYAYCVLIHKPWWLKASLALSVLPITLLVNAVRIAATGLVQVHVSSEAAHRFAHDATGWLMLPLAASLMAAVVWYVGRLLLEVETISTQQLFQGKKPVVQS